eukprot:scaffold75835_cov74-Phaeocystis_antarctica.AAC.1
MPPNSFVVPGPACPVKKRFDDTCRFSFPVGFRGRDSVQKAVSHQDGTDARATAAAAATTSTTVVERGGAAAGAAGGADAARDRQQDGLLRRVPRQPRLSQALPRTGEAWWQTGEPGQLRHRRGGGAVCRPNTRGAGGGGAEGGSAAAADERGGAAAGAGGGAGAARGREQDGLLRRGPR